VNALKNAPASNRLRGADERLIIGFLLRGSRSLRAPQHEAGAGGFPKPQSSTFFSRCAIGNN